jgi:N-acetylglucosamine-6-sulfatase
VSDHSTRRQFLARSAALAGAAAWNAGAQGPEAGKGGMRNIVFILIDDLRYDALGFMGHPFLETPNIDALARDGCVFDNAFVATSLCSPSRATILTGLYAHTHGVFDNSTPLNGSIPTFPRELQKAGYRTAFIGKWHMGGESDEPRPGFDHWVSFRGQGVYVDPTLNINGARNPVSGYVTDLITDHSVDFIQANRDVPFMLYVSHKAVHAEFRPADRHKGCYRDKTYPHPASMENTDDNYRGKPAWVRAQRASWHGVDGMYDKKVDFDQFARDYAETMLAVDDSVGRIVESLRNHGLLESTLLVFTSDNGFQFGEHGLIDKRTMYETSIRVPLIAHCPDLIKAGSRNDKLIVNADFAPTFLEVAGLDAPNTMHGRSFLPLLRGGDAGWRDAILYEYFWERSFPQTPTVVGIRTKTHKFMRYHGIWDMYELYDLATDPDEMHNLLGGLMMTSQSGTLDQFIRRKASPELKELFELLHRRLMELMRETGCAPEPLWGVSETK